MFFISALTQLSLSGVFATWYWIHNKDNVSYFVMTMSATRSIVYHSGTAAFGAWLLAICRIFRWIFIFCECSYIPSCLKGFVKGFDQNAYIMCSVEGKSLCGSAYSANQLMLRNEPRILACVSVAR